MEDFRLLKVRIIFCTILGFTIAACSVASTPPRPEIIPGVYMQSGFEFYRWNEGLTVMLWHDGIKSSGCESSTRQQNFAMQCFAVSEDGQRFNWNLETGEGENAKFSISDQSYDLTNGSLFIIRNSTDGLSVTQLCRDLSKVAVNAEGVTEFGLSDSTVRDFIKSQGHITGCISSYYTSYGSPNEMDVEAARETLINFFSFLNSGDYERAVDLFGGSYTVMQDQNPGIDPGDHVALFRNACTINGAQCLKIRRATMVGQPSPTEFRFAVEFSNNDGSLFTLAPCCESSFSDGPHQTEFIYTTRLECTGKYQVLEMPIYLP